MSLCTFSYFTFPTSFSLSFYTLPPSPLCICFSIFLYLSFTHCSKYFIIASCPVARKIHLRVLLGAAGWGISLCFPATHVFIFSGSQHLLVILPLPHLLWWPFPCMIQYLINISGLCGKCVQVSYTPPSSSSSLCSVACWSDQLPSWHLWVPSEAPMKWQYWGRGGTACLSAAHGFGFLNSMYCAFIFASGHWIRWSCFFVCLCFGFYEARLACVMLRFDVISPGKIMAGCSETWYFNFWKENPN